MSSTYNSSLYTFDEETYHIFMEGFKDVMRGMERATRTLEIDPNDQEGINLIFREIHTLKGNCQLCYLNELGDFVHNIEEVVSGLREHHIIFTPMVKEALLISCDKISNTAEKTLHEQEINYQLFDQVGDIFHELAATVDPMQQEIIASEIVRQLGGEAAKVVPLISDTFSTGAPEPELHCDINHITSGFEDEQLSYLCKLSTLLDARNSNWSNRTLNLTKVVLAINHHLKKPVNEEQLEAAVYSHDLGVSFVGDRDCLNFDWSHPADKTQEETHPLIGAQLLRMMSGWDEAALIVEQHHERIDGHGFPKGLQGNEICRGAKLLSLALAFDDMINIRNSRTQKRSLLRVIASINANTGSLYEREIVCAFNEMIKVGYPSHKKNTH